MKSIMIATLLVGLIGLFIGIVLGIASEKFKVVVDEKEQKIRSALPGNNCGACGYPGCDGLAHAIAKGEAPSNQCPVGGNEVGAKIASILGQQAQASTRYTAFVKCKGTCDKVTPVSDYSGIKDCLSAALVPGKGGKMCASGCIGLGSCVQACEFDAIHIVDGIAVVDKEACKACGKCVAVCPKHLIELIPYEQKTFVRCNSNAKGKIQLTICQAGCIGCRICEKNCEAGAITVTNFLAHIDADKCTECGACVEKCPRKIITLR